jgi:hypothetical protein
MKQIDLTVATKELLLVAIVLGIVCLLFGDFGMGEADKDATSKLTLQGNHSLEFLCDRLGISPTSSDESAFREQLFTKMVENHPQLSLSISKIKGSDQFTAMDRWDLCREVGRAEKAAANVKQTLGLDEPPFG